jgi:hypothetical protein
MENGLLSRRRIVVAVAGLFVTLAPATSRAQFEPINLAQGMFARQSSDYPGGGGDLARHRRRRRR